MINLPEIYLTNEIVINLLYHFSDTWLEVDQGGSRMTSVLYINFNRAAVKLVLQSYADLLHLVLLSQK